MRGTSPWLATETQNIGVGGAFLLAVDLDPGCELEVEIDLPNRVPPLRLPAEVRWKATGTSNGPAGVGVQFHDMDIDIVLELNQYLTTVPETDPSHPSAPDSAKADRSPKR